MERIYCVTCNNHPVITSYDVEKLKDKQKFLLALLADDDTINVISKTENSITYHTGTHYETDEFEIVKLEIL